MTTTRLRPIAATLGFEGARLVGRDVPRLQPILEDPDTEFLVHEVELVDGEREIRFLLWPDGELAIRCRAVTSEWQGIADDTRSAFAHQVVLA
jgi:hypothetical protein